MKIKRLDILIGLFFVLAIVALPFTAHAVVNWTKNPDNPVLTRGGSGSFDEGGLQRPVVINDGGTYKMWYTGINSGGLHSVGYATSSNGTSWTKVSQVFEQGHDFGDWDELHVGYVAIIKDGGTYKMWYTGTDDPDAQLRWQIGYATSADGITWTRYGTTGLLNLKGGADDWDGDIVGTPCVIKDGSTYKMWYIGANFGWGIAIGYATSTDGINWTKYNNPATDSDPLFNLSDPVIQLGNVGAWDYFGLFSPTVLIDGGVYRMWYDGTQTESAPDRIGYAYSFDGGISWTKYDGNPVLTEGTNGSFDEDGVFDAMVLKDGNTYRMYYAGRSVYDEIGYAESYSKLYADFTDYGLWAWNGTAWSFVNSVHPTSMVASDFTLYSDFPGYGLWAWNGTAWSFVNSVHPTSMVTAGSTLYADFEGYGLWAWNGTAWSFVNSVHPTSMVASGTTLYADFPGYGLWAWDGTTWSFVNSVHPTSMVASGSTLYADFEGYGLWAWNGTAWSFVNSVHPTSMVTAGSTLYADFEGYGLWAWNGTAWSFVNSVHPTSMVASGSTLYADFPGYGLWAWDGTAWSFVNSVHPTSMVVGF